MVCVRLRASQPSALGLGCGAGSLSTRSAAFAFVAQASFPDLIPCCGAKVIPNLDPAYPGGCGFPGRPLKNVGVDHRRLHVGVAEELLDRADAVAILEQMRGERVPERMAAGVFLDAGGVNGERDRALHGGFFQVVTPRTPLRGSTEIRHAGKTYCQQTHERR